MPGTTARDSLWYHWVTDPSHPWEEKDEGSTTLTWESQLSPVPDERPGAKRRAREGGNTVKRKSSSTGNARGLGQDSVGIYLRDIRRYELLDRESEARMAWRVKSGDEEARDILRESPGCMVVDKREDEGYVTPVECVGDYATFISRIRNDPTIDNGLNLWVVSDNLRKGAALNTVQIAETLINRHLAPRVQASA